MGGGYYGDHNLPALHYTHTCMPFITHSNLLRRCDAIATAMQARGFVGTQHHAVYVQDTREGSWVLDAGAMVLLVLVVLGVQRL